jgi:dolichyl-phosphate-mannose-protein mannosyltransferase
VIRTAFAFNFGDCSEKIILIFMNQFNKQPQPSFIAYYLTVGINTLLMFFLFFRLAQTRNVDGDEGLYLEAARLVAQGKKLYLDFFFQQMPITPYLYAAWMKVFGFTIFSARYLSATLTALTGMVMLLYVARKTRSLLLISICAVIFYASGMVIAWASVVKTHPLNMFCIIASCVLLLEWRQKQSTWKVLLAALAIGIGVNGRLTLGPFLILYLLFIFTTSEGHRWRDSILFTFIVALTSIPTFYYFFSDPQLFIKYNFTYHTSVYPGIVDSTRRLHTAETLLQQTQLLLLLIAAQWGVLIYLKKSWKTFLASDEAFILGLLVVFVAIHMSSAEPYTQYFVAAVPLLLLLILPLFQKILSYPRIVAIPVLIMFLSFYVIQATPSRNFEISSMLSDRPEWSLKNIQKTVRKIKEVMKPGEVCLTWWPGFAFMAGCQSVPGMENHMRNYAVQRLTPFGLKGYKMMSDEELLEAIQTRKYRLIVDSLYHIDSPLYEKISSAMDENYWQVGWGVKVRTPSWFRALLDKS